MLLGSILTILACTLIGWERQNNASDLLWSMPFKRSHLYITKWLFGICNIAAVVILNWGLFAIMKRLTFHNKYQVFSPFHSYFIYMLIVLIAIYTLALCIGTIAGNVISQGFLTAAILIFPALLPSLISGVIAVHSVPTFMRTMALYMMLWKTYVFLVQQKILLLALIMIHKALILIKMEYVITNQTLQRFRR